MTQLDWRLPENRVEGFLRFYEFQLRTMGHPGAVYMMLPAIAEALELDDDGRAWLVWLNGNTQNVVTSLRLLQAAPEPYLWPHAIDFWNDHFTELEWDMDRRHQKGKFGEATEAWAQSISVSPADDWFAGADKGWNTTWGYAFRQPYMGRLSAWSMTEYARILFGNRIPDAGSFLLEDKAGSRSHRNGLAVIAGYEGAEHWDADVADMLGVTPDLNNLAEQLLMWAWQRSERSEDVSRLSMESALCTYKSHYKVNRRYPNVYHDMMCMRIKRGEKYFGNRFDILWEARKQLPDILRLEDSGPYDPGVAPIKQNWFREHGEFHYLHLFFSDMEPSGFETDVAYVA